MPSTNWPQFAFQNRKIVYDKIDFLEDDYLKLLDHMKTNGETAVPLWLFRSLCESFARFMRRVSGEPDENSSAKDTHLEESLKYEDGEIQENSITTLEALAVNEAKETPSQDSGMQEHSDLDTAKTHKNIDNGNTKDSSTDMVDVYEVRMTNVRSTSMDLSSRPSTLRVAQELINSNRFAGSTSNDILYLRWDKRDPAKTLSNLSIGFTRLEMAKAAIEHGMKWAEVSHACVPFAKGHKLQYCSNCFLHGHSQKQCKSAHRCSKCGSEHSKLTCLFPGKKCTACGGPHNSASTKCPQLLIEMSKAGFWPLRVRVTDASNLVVDKDTSENRGRSMSQSKPQSDPQQRSTVQSAPRNTSQGAREPSDPLDPKKMIEHLDRLRALVLSSKPTVPSSAKEPTRAKRKAESPVRHVYGNSKREPPKRPRREEAHIKQERKDDVLAQWERLYT